MANPPGPYADLAERLRAAARAKAGLRLSSDDVGALLFGGVLELIGKLEIDELRGRPTPFPLSEQVQPDAAGPGGAFTVASLAAHWGVSTGKVYEEIHAGRLDAFKLGGKLYRIRPEAVAEYEREAEARRPPGV